MLQLPPRPHLNRLSASELRTIAGCVARVLRDSERTGDIITAEEISAQGQLRHLLDCGVFDTEEGRALLADRPDLSVNLDELRELPPDTLGGAVAAFYDDNGLSTELCSVPAHHTSDPDAAFLMRRLRQGHDIWHVLMGFGVQGHEEILVHAFSLAQTGLPSSVMLLALGSLKHMVLEGRFHCFLKGMAEAFRRGRQADSLIPVYWERHWQTPLSELRERLHITPWNNKDHAASQPWAWSAAHAA